MLRSLLHAALAAFAFGGPLWAADRITLTADTWGEAAPEGKEVDAIYGDIVLRNGAVVAVIGQPAPTRNANMTIKNVGGCLIDLTRRAAQADQLGAFFPGGRSQHWQGEIAADLRDQPSVSYTVHAPGDLSLETKYTLADGWDYLVVETTVENRSDKPMPGLPNDEIRADRSFTKAPSGPAELFWCYDPWCDQAYGVVAEGVRQSSTTDGNLSSLSFDRGAAPPLGPGEKFTLVRRIFPASGLAEEPFDLPALAAQVVEDHRHRGDVVLDVVRRIAPFGQLRNESTELLQVALGLRDAAVCPGKPDTGF